MLTEGDLQPIVEELTAMKAIIEILAPLPSATRSRIVAWLQGVVSPPRMEASGVTTADPTSPPPVTHLVARLAALSQEGLQAPGDDEKDDAPRSLWRKKHG